MPTRRGNTLEFNNAVTNSGTFEATNGGILLLGGNTIVNNTSITADGGTVNLSSATVEGGSLTAKKRRRFQRQW